MRSPTLGLIPNVMDQFDHEFSLEMFRRANYARHFDFKVKEAQLEANFEPIHLTQNLEDAAEIILSDRKHLDYNPRPVSKNVIIDLLKKINSTDV